jgi:hypothetical protein
VFIKGRAIYGNFRAVQLSAKLLHTRKRSGVPLKIDIAKAFDTVSWLFLIELLEFVGFSCRWTNWLSFLLSMGSSRILLNGSPGLGVPDLAMLGHMLCLRWAWLARVDSSRSWSALPIKGDSTELPLF